MVNESFELTSWCHHGYIPLEYGEELGVVPEPENEYDPEAIALYKGVALAGYVPAHLTKRLRAALDNGEWLTATVTMEGDEELGVNPIVLVRDSAARDAGREEKKAASLDLPVWLALPLGIALLLGGMAVAVLAFFHLFDGTFFPRLLTGFVMLAVAYLVMR